MRKKLALLAIFLLASGTCSASFIRMGVETRNPSLIEGNQFIMNVTVANTGDEPAYDVALSLELPDGFQADDLYVGTLYPNKPFHSKFIVNIDVAVPGRYPIILKTNYADANAYPFSTVAPKFIDYLQHAKTLTRAALETVEISGEETKEVNLKIRNVDKNPHTYKVNFHAPNEISVEDYESVVDISGSSEKDVKFMIKSFGALPDSSYVVVATIEYDDSSSGETIHKSFIASGMTKIVKAGQVEYIPPWLPVIILLILIAAFIYFQFKKKKNDTVAGKDAVDATEDRLKKKK